MNLFRTLMGLDRETNVYGQEIGPPYPDPIPTPLDRLWFAMRSQMSDRRCNNCAKLCYGSSGDGRNEPYETWTECMFWELDPYETYPLGHPRREDAKRLYLYEEIYGEVNDDLAQVCPHFEFTEPEPELYGDEDLGPDCWDW